MRKYLILYFLLIISLSMRSQILQDQWVECNKTGCKLLDPYYSDGETVVWDGACKDGKADGFGKAIKYQKGVYESTYEGEYSKGIREGKGKFSHITGTTLECSFINGQAIGYGTYTYPEGNRYEGNIFNYRTHGLGTFYYANGSKFEGFFVSDRRYTGKFTSYDGKIIYYQAGKIVDKIKESTSDYHPKLNEIVTEYFDENWKRCEPKNAAYYRRITYEAENKPIGRVKDYYIFGQLQSDYSCLFLDYEDEGKNFHEGEAIWYYKNGQISQKIQYFNNQYNGKYTQWFENGQKSSEYSYDHGRLEGFCYRWYKSGNLNQKAYYHNGNLSDRKYIEFDENGLGSIVYQEVFVNNKSDWENKNETSETKIDPVNNLVYFNNNGQASFARGAYIPFNQDGSYSIEVIIDRKDVNSNMGAGLSFGFKDWDNYYQFIISGTGTYKIYGKFEGVYFTITDWTSSYAINRDNGTHRNLLKVLKLDDTFIFSINGIVVAKEPSKPLRGNYTGALIGGEGKIILESLTIREFVVNSNGSNENETPKKNNVDEGWLGNGSGFFINEKGYIATNYHVIKEATEIQVEFFQKGIKKSYQAKVIQFDKENDLAIIQISDPNFKSFTKLQIGRAHV